jgi:carbamoylphosphate synthase large subunit
VTLIWFNQGYSSVRDALVMIREEAGNKLGLLASHRDLNAPVMHIADHILREPSIDHSSEAGERGYLNFCLETCAERGVRLFVAQSGRALLAPHKAAFEAIGTKLLVPAGRPTLELIDDKAEFYKAAAAANIPMPLTYEVNDAEGYDAALAALAQLSLTACVKPHKGVFGNGFWKLGNNRQLFDTLMNPDKHEIAPAAMRYAVSGGENVRLLVLEYLPGPEWSIDLVCKDGQVIVAVARQKLGRVQTLQVEGPVFEIVAHAVRHFNLSGLINAQCKAADMDGNDVRLLEINSRMSGGCIYTRYSGVKLPWVQVALELGLMMQEEVPQPIGGALVCPSAEAYEIKAGRDERLVKG